MDPVRLRFDRGTLLIDAPQRSSVAALSGVSWDPRVHAFRAPAHRYPEFRAALTTQSPAIRDEVRPIPSLCASWRPFELRSYQRAAVDGWAASGCRGLVVLPTGSGKTRVALAAMRERARPTLCLVPTIALLEQWASVLEQAVDAPVGRLGDRVRRVEAITVSTYESALRHMHYLGDRFDLLVVDEAHHFGVGRRDEALEMSIAPARLGLTATAPDDPYHLTRLSRLVGPVVCRLSLGDLAGTHLAPLTHTKSMVELNPDERVAYQTKFETYSTFEAWFRRQHPNYRWAELVQEAMKSLAGRRALYAWREIRRILAYPEAKRARLGELLRRHEGARVLVFCADNAAAYAIAREHLLMPITCDIDRRERAWAFEAFVQGRLRGLVSARVLNEGIDLPSADVAIVVSGAHGGREHIQRIGRILRPAEGKQAILWELVARGTLEVGWSRRRNDGVDPGARLRLRDERPRDHPSLFRAG